MLRIIVAGSPVVWTPMLALATESVQMESPSREVVAKSTRAYVVEDAHTCQVM